MTDAIYIGQYFGTSTISKLIRWRTWSDVSHTAAFLGEDLDEVVEAWQGVGVIRRPWTEGHEPGTRIELYRVDCTPEERRLFWQFIHEQIGKGYDYTGILGFMTRTKSECADKWFCSELVFAAARHAGIELLARIEPHQVAPGVLHTSPRLAKSGVRFTP